MEINYINKQLTDEEFFKRVYEKGKSRSSEKKVRATINHLEYFTQDKYQKSRFNILKDLKDELDKSKDTTLVLRFLQHFIDWLGEVHPEIRFFTHPNDKTGRPIPKKNYEVIRSYLGIIKKYIKLCHGIKIDDDDFSEWLTIPVNDQDDEEPELGFEEYRRQLGHFRYIWVVLCLIFWYSAIQVVLLTLIGSLQLVVILGSPDSLKSLDFQS